MVVLSKEVQELLKKYELDAKEKGAGEVIVFFDNVKLNCMRIAAQIVLVRDFDLVVPPLYGVDYEGCLDKNIVGLPQGWCTGINRRALEASMEYEDFLELENVGLFYGMDEFYAALDEDEDAEFSVTLDDHDTKLLAAVLSEIKDVRYIFYDPLAESDKMRFGVIHAVRPQ